MKVDQLIVDVVLVLPDIRIEAKLYLPSGGRLSDYLALAERKFIPLTDARVFFLPDNRLLYEVKFLNVNKDSVLFLFPCEDQAAAVS